MSGGARGVVPVFDQFDGMDVGSVFGGSGLWRRVGIDDVLNYGRKRISITLPLFFFPFPFLLCFPSRSVLTKNRVVCAGAAL